MTRRSPTRGKATHLQHAPGVEHLHEAHGIAQLPHVHDAVAAATQ
jgi:hypothetical protein